MNRLLAMDVWFLAIIVVGFLVALAIPVVIAVNPGVAGTALPRLCREVLR